MRQWQRALARKLDGFLDLIDRTRLAGWVVGLGLLALSLPHRFLHNLSGDSATYLYLARRLLRGEQYYTDFFEYNTPFAIGAYTLPLAMAQAFGMSEVLFAKAFVLLLIPACLLFIHSLLIRSEQWHHVTRYNALIIALFFALAFRSDYESNEITTKTYLYLLCIMPYVFSIQLLLEGRGVPAGMRVATGLLLGYALCLKPHYALMPLVMESYVVLKTRTLRHLRRDTLLTAVGFVVGALIVILVLFPGYLKGMRYFFAYYAHDFTDPIRRVDLVAASLLYLLPFSLWWFALRDIHRKYADYGVLCSAVVGAFAVVNGEGLWSTDQKSAFSFFVNVLLIYSCIVVLRTPAAERIRLHLWQKFTASTAVILAAAGTLHLVPSVMATLDMRPMPRERLVGEMREAIARWAPQGRFYTISDSTEHFIPAMLEINPPPPYPVFPYFRGLVQLSQRNRWSNEVEYALAREARDYLYQTTLDYFQQQQPEVVFVSQRSITNNFHQCLAPPLELMLRQKDFQLLWETHYRKVSSILIPENPPLFDPPQEQFFELNGRRVTLPPASPVDAWLDVYVRY